MSTIRAQIDLATGGGLERTGEIDLDGDLAIELPDLTGADDANQHVLSVRLAALPLDAALARILAAARVAWPDETSPKDMNAVIGTIAGDIARAERDLASRPGYTVAHWREDMKRELFNVGLTALRLADDLGIDPVQGVDAATAGSIPDHHHDPSRPAHPNRYPEPAATAKTRPVDQHKEAP